MRHKRTGYIHHRKNNYDHSEKIKGAVKGNVVEWAKEPTVLPALLAEAAPRVGVMGVTTTQLPELTVLWFAVRLMRVKQSLFPRTNPAADPIVLDPYDVLHGWNLLAFAWKQIAGDHNAGGMRAGGMVKRIIAITLRSH